MQPSRRPVIGGGGKRLHPGRGRRSRVDLASELPEAALHPRVARRERPATPPWRHWNGDRHCPKRPNEGRHVARRLPQIGRWSGERVGPGQPGGDRPGKGIPLRWRPHRNRRRNRQRQMRREEWQMLRLAPCILRGIRQPRQTQRQVRPEPIERVRRAATPDPHEREGRPLRKLAGDEAFHSRIAELHLVGMHRHRGRRLRPSADRC